MLQGTVLLTGENFRRRPILVISTGKVIQTVLTTWTEDRWDDGVVNDRGKFMVFRPDFPKCSASGWVHRARVVWWLHTGEVPEGEDIHHDNEIKLDDRFENLRRMDHGEHSRLHNIKPLIQCVCITCGKEFGLPQWRINEGKGKYCSLSCYHSYPKSTLTRLRMSFGLCLAYEEGRR